MGKSSERRVKKNCWHGRSYGDWELDGMGEGGHTGTQTHTIKRMIKYKCL